MFSSIMNSFSKFHLSLRDEPIAWYFSRSPGFNPTPFFIFRFKALYKARRFSIGKSDCCKLLIFSAAFGSRGWTWKANPKKSVVVYITLEIGLTYWIGLDISLAVAIRSREDNRFRLIDTCDWAGNSLVIKTRLNKSTITRTDSGCWTVPYTVQF